MKNTNKKGMTLVEVIISMCILAAIAGMFVTVAVAAKKKNTDTYLRSNEMYEQAAAAEAFDTSKDYGAGSSHIKKLLTGGASSTNEYKLTADFGTLKLEPKTYGYVAERRNKDKNDTNYQLRFFRSDIADLDPPDPSTGTYWIKITNHSGIVNMHALLVGLDEGVQFYTTKKSSLKYKANVPIGDEDTVIIGVCRGYTDQIFSFNDWRNENVMKTFTISDLDKYMEKEDGKATGYISIHVCEGLEIKTNEEYAETGAASTSSPATAEEGEAGEGGAGEGGAGEGGAGEGGAGTDEG